MEPRNKQQVGMDIPHIESVCFELINEVCNARRLVVFWDANHGLWNYVPTELLIHFLSGCCLYSHMYPVEYFIEKF
jgi:hypothetical protein